MSSRKEGTAGVKYTQTLCTCSPHSGLSANVVITRVTYKRSCLWCFLLRFRPVFLSVRWLISVTLTPVICQRVSKMAVGAGVFSSVQVKELKVRLVLYFFYSHCFEIGKNEIGCLCCVPLLNTLGVTLSHSSTDFVTLDTKTTT